MEDIRDWSFIESRINNLPPNYYNVKNEILNFTSIHLPDTQRIGCFVHESFEDLRSQWERKYAFYLTRDLLEHHRDLYESFDETLLEIDSILTGFCNPLLIKPFTNEEKYLYDLTGYVRSNMWINT